MKKLILILLAHLIFSCGGKSSENPNSGNVLENVTFTVDTVIVDSGDDIFILSYDLEEKVSIKTKAS